MKFRVSLAGSGSSNGAGALPGGIGGQPNMAMNYNPGNIGNAGTEGFNPSNVLGGLGEGGGIILSSDEVLEVSYNTIAITGETMSETQSEITLKIVGRLLPSTVENNAGSEGSEGIAGGIMGALGMGTLFNQYQNVKSMFGKESSGSTSGESKSLFSAEDIEKGSVRGSSLLSSTGASESSTSSGKSGKSALVSQVLGVSSAIPLTSSFTRGINNSLSGMFGGLSSFGAENFYEQNKQNIIELSKWAMIYGDDTSTKDVLVQADLGSGKTMELFFPKMYVYSFDQDFSVGSGEGYFSLILKQTGFNEDNISLK